MPHHWHGPQVSNLTRLISVMDEFHGKYRSFINKNYQNKYKALNLVIAKLRVLHYYPPKRSFVLETKVRVTTYLVITNTNTNMNNTPIVTL
jgi:hypothetical protein